MGNSASRECHKCGCSLPPCKRRKDFHKETLDGRHVYVFNGGQYYREVKHADFYECPTCFWKPKRDRELAEKTRQEEKERRQQEEQERKEREEILRKEREQLLRREREDQQRKQKEEQQRREREDQQRKQKVEQQRREREDQQRKQKEEQQRSEREDQQRKQKEEQQRREREDQQRKQKEEQQRREREDQQRKQKEEQQRREREDQQRKQKEEQQRRERERRKSEEQQRREREEQQRKQKEEVRKIDLNVFNHEHTEKEGTYEEDDDEDDDDDDYDEEEDEEEENYDEEDEDSLLDMLSTKLNSDFSSLKLQDLSPQQVEEIIQILKELFIDWTNEPPSQHILEQLQVLLIELIIGSCEIDEDTALVLELQAELHDLINTMSDSTQSVKECLHLTQTLFHLFQYECKTIRTSSSTDKSMLHLAETWANCDILIKDTILLNFLETLLKNLKDFDSSLSTNTQLICCELLIERVMRYWKAEGGSDITEKLLGLVQTQLWSPSNLIELLRILSDKHPNDILKILHLIEIYRVSNTWKGKDGKSLTHIVQLDRMTIKKLDLAVARDEAKGLDEVINEIKKGNLIEKSTLNKIRNITINVLVDTNLKNHPDMPKEDTLQKRRKDFLLTNGQDINELQKLLELLCRSVHEVKGWWPRVTQMVSWCLLALTNSGKLLEVATGEGKSCIIAMFAVFRVLKGEKIDIVSCSSVLSERDVKDWKDFYSLFNITVDTNTDKTEDEDRNRCYGSDVVYGTVETFSADFLRQNFEMKQIFPQPRFQCIIVDEVDSLMLDQGLQFTYLSSDMPGMQDLGPILAMIWCSVSQCGYVASKTETFLRGPLLPFYKALHEGTDIEDPLQILEIAEQKGLVPPGATEDVLSGKQDILKYLLSTANHETMLNILSAAEEYFPYKWLPYTLDDKGTLQLRMPPGNEGLEQTNQDIPHLPVLIVEDGLCCALYDAYEDYSETVAENVKKHIQYTPCDKNKGDALRVPGFLKDLVEAKLQTWVENAFLAIRLQEGREYLVQEKQVLPVDFKSTGIVEMNKKWGDGLQQFLEMKHLTKVSTLSTITNYISNVRYFNMYNGQIYGTTGTLGTESDQEFLQKLYSTLSVCRIPTFNRKKLFEEKGLIRSTKEEWQETICSVIRKKVKSTSYRKGRAALVICEDINKANDLYEVIKNLAESESEKTIKVRQYTRNDGQHGNVSDFDLNPGDVIVATNLAGRGTDIKVSEEVVRSGGLFVVLTFLSQNARVELQAFGRTARKGQPGSAQVIVCSSDIPFILTMDANIDKLKDVRDYRAKWKVKHIMEDEIVEVNLREKLFLKYCSILSGIYKSIANKGDKKVTAAIMNEYWGTWLQIKSKDLVQRKGKELEESLEKDTEMAKHKSQSSESPLSSIYHYIKFGNNLLSAGKTEECAKFLEKAMNLDPSWAAIAFYNHAYCTLKQRKENYLDASLKDLEKSVDSLHTLKEQCLVTASLLQLSVSHVKTENKTEFQKNIHIKVQVLDFFEKNILTSILNLKDIQSRHSDAVTVESAVFSLGLQSDSVVHEELYELYKMGLLNVFSVEEKPRFCWEGLGVFLLGVIQIVGGVLLTALTAGTLSSIGMALITEGVSDCIDGVTAVVEGEFSWGSWAISKAISIGVSLIGSGIGKVATKAFEKDLTRLPEMLTSEIRSEYTAVMKENTKNAFKYAGKEMAQQTVMYGIGKHEEVVLNRILEKIETQIQAESQKTMREKVQTKQLRPIIDRLVMSQLTDPKEVKLLLDPGKPLCDSVKNVFSEFVHEILNEDYRSLERQNQLFSAITDVIEKAKTEVQGRKKTILNIIEIGYLSTLNGLAINNVNNLLNDFASKLSANINTLMDEKKTLSTCDLSEDDEPILAQFRETLADSISKELGTLLVQTFHQKFAGHLVKEAQSKINQYASSFISNKLNTNRTVEKLKGSSAALYITHMAPTIAFNKIHPADQDYFDKYIRKIQESNTTGSVLDLKMLSETTGTKVMVSEKDKKGKLQTKHVLEPSSSRVHNTIHLVYRTASKDDPEGHYDVCINSKIYPVRSEGKSCMYHAFAQALHPEAQDSKLPLKAKDLRGLGIPKIEQLQKLIKKGDTVEYVTQQIGRVDSYKNNRKKVQGFGCLLNADHQPPINSILNACQTQLEKTLAKSLLQLALGNKYQANLTAEEIQNLKKKCSFCDLPSVVVPYDMHKEFLTTGRSFVAVTFRRLITEAIQSGNAVKMLKLTFIGGQPITTLKIKADKHNTEILKIDAYFGIGQHERKVLLKNQLKVINKTLLDKWKDIINKTDYPLTTAHLEELKLYINDEAYLNDGKRFLHEIHNVDFQPTEKNEPYEMP
ncbi:uncharacterized protein LOC117434967 [Acipenser ruthenus]|uniref:uncharacterized protein LOC117434967 n=1 Tax=Acipenser ruthenus TaxID=7906 RepID=UPI0027415B97|nr:uncharacterized protein LOC117434967 [Acipenser ruthenus]XP_058859142.1 uncharacterized protein LOC117434967 [Acipenser ruthenus]XP_058859143.1 uncharacterized protein LOC117434967 [Acipenser ruthenus]